MCSCWRCWRWTSASFTARRTSSRSRSRSPGRSCGWGWRCCSTAASGTSTARQKALEFFTGYLIEKSLSVDNVFVFALLFSYFAVPAKYQHKVLFWGILGALDHAGHHDRAGRGAHHQVHLDHLRVRRVPDPHRHQDGREARGGNPSRAQPGGALVQEAHAGDGGLSRATSSSCARMASAWPRRCSWCCCWWSSRT